MSDGIVRKIDDLGRTVIPIEMRNSLDIGAFDELEMFQKKNEIVIRKHETKCIFCYAINSSFKFNQKLICDECLKKLKSKIDSHIDEVNNS